MTQNSFNLIDEAWIPVAGVGLVSLRDIFARDDLHSLGGTAIQKIALFKLCIAIAQAASTPEDDSAWAAQGAQGMSHKALAYLEKWHESFWLYGEKPFLQMPAVKKAKCIEYGLIMPEIGSDNSTMLTQWQQKPLLTDADRALLLLVNMSCCFSGKKTDASIVLSQGHSKKSAKSGSALCHMGLLHTFLTGNSIQQSVWLNLFPHSTIADYVVYTEGLGTPPWEDMPQGEICTVAEKLKSSFMGRLVPMARFCLLEDEGLRYVEGLQHPDYLQGYADSSASIKEKGKKPQMLWADPGKRPWRSLSALLSFLNSQNMSDGFSCPNVKYGILRLQGHVEQFGVWSGGIRVSSNAGEQYLSGTDDMVESEIRLSVATIYDAHWFLHLQQKMSDMEAIAKNLCGCVKGYYRRMKANVSKKHAEEAIQKKRAQEVTRRYWQLAEPHFQALIDACDADEEQQNAVMQHFVKHALVAFHMTCPQDTARQIQAWAQCRPRLGKFLNKP